MMEDRGKEITILPDLKHIRTIGFISWFFLIEITLFLISLIGYIILFLNANFINQWDTICLFTLLMINVANIMIFIRCRYYIHKKPNILFEKGILLTPFEYFRNKQIFIPFKNIVDINFKQSRKWVKLEIYLKNTYFSLFLDDINDYNLIMDNMSKSNLKLYTGIEN